MKYTSFRAAPPLLLCLQQLFYLLAQLFKKKKLTLYRHFSDFSPIAGFLSLVRVTQFSQFEKGILCP